MDNFLLGVLGGFVAWIATTIVGQPLYNFMALRSIAAATLAEYEREDSGPMRNAGSASWLDKRKQQYEQLGSRLVAFEATNACFGRVLHRCRFYPKSAGYGFHLLADLSPGAEARAQARDQIISGLRLAW